MALAGEQPQVRAGQTGFEVTVPAGTAGELRRPFATPTHGGNHAAVGALHVEEGQHLTGGAPAAGVQTGASPPL